MSGYIHGTSSNQIFVNHRTGCFIESKKFEVVNSISDWPMKFLLFSIAKILPQDLIKTHFKMIELFTVPSTHTDLLLNHDILINTSTQWKESNGNNRQVMGKNQN